jgi:hypothetical protein
VEILFCFKKDWNGKPDPKGNAQNKTSYLLNESMKIINPIKANTESICHQGNILVWLGENIIDSKHEKL